jgi:cell division protein FtsI/penicillin-binding protein 2
MQEKRSLSPSVKATFPDTHSNRPGVWRAGLSGILNTLHVVSRDDLEHWGKKVDVSFESRFELSTETVEKVTLGLWGVVNEWGTGRRAAVAGFDVCGKTGTAQVVAKDLKVSAESKDEFGDNAWFVGFAPRQAPEIAAAVFVEHGGHGVRRQLRLFMRCSKSITTRKQSLKSPIN